MSNPDFNAQDFLQQIARLDDEDIHAISEALGPCQISITFANILVDLRDGLKPIGLTEGDSPIPH